MESHFRQKFRAQIPEAEAAQHRKPHLTACGLEIVSRFPEGGKSLTAEFDEKEPQRTQRKWQLRDLCGRSLRAFAVKSLWSAWNCRLAKV